MNITFRNLLESIDRIAEDDYYPPADEPNTREEDVRKFVDHYVEEYLGKPHRSNVGKHFGKLTIWVSIPRYKISDKQRLAYMKEDWKIVADELIDDLQSADLGEFKLSSLGPFSIELVYES